MTTKHIDFLTPLSVLPKFGEKRVAALAASELYRIEDLLYYFPRKYIDKRRATPLSELSQHIDTTVFIRGEILSVSNGRGRNAPLRVHIGDGTGTVELVWFQGGSYLSAAMQKGVHISALGKVSFYKSLQMTHPEVDMNTQTQQLPIEPRYLLTQPMRTAKIGQKILRDATLWVFKNLRHYPSRLPQKIEKRYHLLPLDSVLRSIHFPSDLESLEEQYNRVKVEELYQTAITLRWRQRSFQLPGIAHTKSSLQQQVINTLPYTLTDSQGVVLKEITKCISSENRLHALMQGDVGCGKTVVAFLSTLPALEEGFQVAWLTPTTLLAKQTYRALKQWLEPFEIEPQLLTGDITPSQKRTAIRQLKLGYTPIVVGTHALIQERVDFKRLGMVVIDEQHRFGSQQRQMLQKLAPSADHLMLSATPIPQTLAQTVYAELDLLTISSLPNGRIPIKTHVVPPHKQQPLLTYLKEQVTSSSKAFWVVPRIESVEENISLLADIDNRYNTLISNGFTQQQIAVVHGQQAADIRETEMRRFSDGEAIILLATSVIEVGLHIPEATFMIIENAERFGLAQLHQIRGRVGRSTQQSYAYLLYPPTISEISYDRLIQFCDAKDGFQIAELDLQLRGTGEVAGLRQSGMSELKYSNILEEAPLFRELQQEIQSML